MRESDKIYLLSLADMLGRGLTREKGNLRDEPEGTNCVRLSDTLAREMARRIREAALDD